MQHDVAPIRPPLKPAGLPMAAAAAELGLSLRRIRGMVRAGDLVVIGCGRKKVVSIRSFEQERDRRTKLRLLTQRSGNSGKDVSAASGRLLARDSGSGYSEPAMIRPPQQNPILLPISRAAAVVGLSERTMRAVVERGEIPAVTIGPRRRINSEVLRQWALGRRG